MRKILLLGKDENGKYIQHIRRSKMSDSKQKFEQLEEEARSYSGIGPNWDQSDTSQQFEDNKSTKYYLVSPYYYRACVRYNVEPFISKRGDWYENTDGYHYDIKIIELK